MIQNKIFPRVNQHDLNENGHEIKRILNKVMSDALCMCFTGRISRLLNCLPALDPNREGSNPLFRICEFFLFPFFPMSTRVCF